MEPLKQNRGGRYLTFQLSGQYFAVPAERVIEIMPAKSLVQAPAAAGPVPDGVALLGVLHTQGRRLPVLDVHTRLGIAPSGREPESYVVIRMIKDGDGAPFDFGFAVDHLTDLINVRTHEIRRDVLYGHGRPKTILDFDALFPNGKRPGCLS